MTKAEQEIADRARRMLAEGYMNQVGVEWDEACDDAERAWARFMAQAQDNVLVAEGMAYSEAQRYADM